MNKLNDTLQNAQAREVRSTDVFPFKEEEMQQPIELADVQDEIGNALLTLWERTKAHAHTDPKHQSGIHYRVIDAFMELEHTLLKYGVIEFEVIEPSDPTRI